MSFTPKPEWLNDVKDIKVKSDLIDISAELHHETNNAFLLFDGRMETKDNQ